MLDQILSFIFFYKYFALFLMTFFASLLNITPATPSLIASGSLIAKGHLNYFQVFLFGYLGAVFGDIIAYIISYKYSKEILVKIGFRKMLNSMAFIKAENLFKKNAGKTIFFSRFFLASLGPVVNIIAGLSKINYKKFILYDLTGEAIYIFLFTGIGYLFANNWKYISNFMDYINIILVVLVIILIYLYFRAKNSKKNKIVI